MVVVDLVGWYLRDKGVDYLVTPHRWWGLVGDRVRSVPNESAVKVRGRIESKSSLMAESVESLEPAGSQGNFPAGRPWFVRHGLPYVEAQSALRFEAERWLQERGFPYVTMPALWRRTEEYGALELEVQYAGESVNDLRLLQSPELPVFVAMAEGLTSFRTFGRCFRREAVHEPSKDGNYLMEFEQLVVARAGSTLDEIKALVEELIKHLASIINVEFAAREFVSVDLRKPLFDDRSAVLLEFTVPHSWSLAARRVLEGRLKKLEGSVYIVDGSELNSWDPSSTPDGDQQLLIFVSEEAEARVRNVLTVAGNYVSGEEDRGNTAAAVGRSLSPTWYVYPPLALEDGEQPDSNLSVRSFTSVREGVGEGCFLHDAELHLGGVEVSHIREHASAVEMLGYARDAGVRADFSYLESTGAHFNGLVSGTIGWERLVSVLLGAGRLANVSVFARNGVGEPINYPGV